MDIIKYLRFSACLFTFCSIAVSTVCAQENWARITGNPNGYVNDRRDYSVTFIDGSGHDVENPPGTVYWTFPTGVQVLSSSDYACSLKLTQKGTFRLYYEISTWDNFYYDDLDIVVTDPPGPITVPQTPSASFWIHPKCGYTEVELTSSLLPVVQWYWQTEPNGTRTDLGFNQVFKTRQPIILYLRARLAASPYTWSTGSQNLGSILVNSTVPDPPTTNDVHKITNGSPVTVSINPVSGAHGYNWYNINGEYFLGGSYTQYTRSLSATTSYLVESRIYECESSHRNTVTAYIYPEPEIVGTLNGVVIDDVPVTLSVKNFIYDTYEWLDEIGNVVGVGQNFTTTQTGKYKVRVKKALSDPFISTTSFSVNKGFNGLNANYVVENTLRRDKVFDIASVNDLPIETHQQVIQYFDGLGRKTQSVSTKGSSLLYDVVRPVRYDQFGRISTVYLPYVSDERNGWYKRDALAAEGQYEQSRQHQFYGSGKSTGVAQDNSPYAVQIFEPSPLNRPIKQGFSGTVWQPGRGAANHVVEYQYRNNSENEVIIWKWNSAQDRLLNGGYYEVSKLRAKVTRNEHHYETIEFRDLRGRIILKKVEYGKAVNGSVLYTETYYVYDDYGNLISVLPPEAVNALKKK